MDAIGVSLHLRSFGSIGNFDLELAQQEAFAHPGQEVALLHLSNVSMAYGLDTATQKNTLIKLFKIEKL
jgi:hypothetical protein